MDVIELQAYLRQEQMVSVPKLQQVFGLGYAQARQLLQKMTDLTWVDPTEGVCYPVVAERLIYRNIRPEEVDSLIRDINNDTMTALDLIHNENGITDERFYKVMPTEVGAAFALGVLLENGLICKLDGRYYVRVSQQAVAILQKVEMRKRRLKYLSGEGKERAMERIKGLFDELFT